MKHFLTITLSLIILLLSPLTLAKGCCVFGSEQSQVHCKEHLQGSQHCCHDHQQDEQSASECQCDHHIGQTGLPLTNATASIDVVPVDSFFVYLPSHYSRYLPSIYRPPIT
jgi:hypothetical protein